MGIKVFLPNYLEGSDYFVGFSSVNLSLERIVLDALCLRSQAHILLFGGDFTPSLQEFQREMVYLAFTLKWDLVVVFDGCDSAIKRHERRRRDLKQANPSSGNASHQIRNLPIYVAMVAGCVCVLIHQSNVPAIDGSHFGFFRIVRFLFFEERSKMTRETGSFHPVDHKGNLVVVLLLFGRFMVLHLFSKALTVI